MVAAAMLAISQWLQHKVPVTEGEPEPTAVASMIELRTWHLVLSIRGFLKPGSAVWLGKMLPKAWTQVSISSLLQWL